MRRFGGKMFGINEVESLERHSFTCFPPTAVVMAKGRLLFLAAMAILTLGRSLPCCNEAVKSIRV